MAPAATLSSCTEKTSSIVSESVAECVDDAAAWSYICCARSFSSTFGSYFTSPARCFSSRRRRSGRRGTDRTADAVQPRELVNSTDRSKTRLPSAVATAVSATLSGLTDFSLGAPPARPPSVTPTAHEKPLARASANQLLGSVQSPGCGAGASCSAEAGSGGSLRGPAASWIVTSHVAGDGAEGVDGEGGSKGLLATGAEGVAAAKGFVKFIIAFVSLEEVESQSKLFF